MPTFSAVCLGFTLILSLTSSHCRTFSLSLWPLTCQSAWYPRLCQMQAPHSSNRWHRLWGSVWVSGLCCHCLKPRQPFMEAPAQFGDCKATQLLSRLLSPKPLKYFTNLVSVHVIILMYKYCRLTEGDMHPDGAPAWVRGLRGDCEQPAGCHCSAASLPAGTKWCKLSKCYAQDPDPDHSARPQCPSESPLIAHSGQPWRSVSRSATAHGTHAFCCFSHTLLLILPPEKSQLFLCFAFSICCEIHAHTSRIAYQCVWCLTFGKMGREALPNWLRWCKTSESSLASSPKRNRQARWVSSKYIYALFSMRHH